MTTFDYYIIRRLLTGYLGMLGGVIVFFIVLHYVEYMDDFLDRGASAIAVLTVYYPNSIPEIIQLGSPLAIFLSAIYFTGCSAQSLEIASLQTSGVSLYRLMIPFAVVGIMVSVFMLGFNGWIVPKTNRVKIAFEQEYTKSATGRIDYSIIHRQIQPGTVLSVGYFDRKTNTASTISIQTFDAQLRMVERLDAVRMTWVDSTKTWTLLEPEIRTFDMYGTEKRKIFAAIDTVLQVLPRDLARSGADVDAMTITEAREYLDELERTGSDWLDLPRVSYLNKFAYPVSNFILILLAVPFSSVRRRGGQALRLGLGLFIAFVYLATIKLLQPFGYTGSLSPMMATWLPHIFFGFSAVVVLFKTRT